MVTLSHTGTTVIEGRRIPIDSSYDQITGLSTAKGLTSPPATAHLCLIQTEAQAVRWRDDGGTPTASLGMRLQVGETLNFSKIKFIEESASAKVNAIFYV